MEIKKVSSAEAPLHILQEADPSVEKIRSYLSQSECFVATCGATQVGAYVVQELASDIYELMSIAVVPAYQRKGLGSKLLSHVIGTARTMGARRLEVGTGTFGYQLAYYQRAGFRVFALETDFFLKNYEEPVYENGIQHKDMLRLAVTF